MGRLNREQNERVEYALRGAQGDEWLRAACPFCEELGHRDRKYSLAVHAGSGKWFCHRCGEEGRLLSPPDPTLERGEAQEDEEEIELFDVPDEYVPLWNDRSLTFKPARRYLRSRGVNRVLMRELEIGACASGYWGGRILVPLIVKDFDGWLGWVARLWTKPTSNAEGRAGRPYDYPKGMPRGKFFFNHDALYTPTDRPLLVVEGVFDAFPYYPDAIAVYGKPSHVHAASLRAAARPIVCLLDGDAHRQSWVLAAKLRLDNVRAGFVKLPPKSDPSKIAQTHGTDWVWERAKRSLEVPL